MDRRRCLQFLVLVAYLASTAPQLQASIVKAMDLAQLTQSADQIVVADVLSVNAAWDRDHRTIYSTVELGVQETWKGEAPGSGKMVLRHLGGSVGDIEMEVKGEVGFAAGERAVLFLHNAHTVGMAQGKRLVRWEPSAKRWLVSPSVHAGALVIPGRKGSAPVDTGSTEESLDVLRAQVRALIGK